MRNRGTMINRKITAPSSTKVSVSLLDLTHSLTKETSGDLETAARKKHPAFRDA
jgi:hypothetical protein